MFMKYSKMSVNTKVSSELKMKKQALLCTDRHTSVLVGHNKLINFVF